MVLLFFSRTHTHKHPHLYFTLILQIDIKAYRCFFKTTFDPLSPERLTLRSLLCFFFRQVQKCRLDEKKEKRTHDAGSHVCSVFVQSMSEFCFSVCHCSCRTSDGQWFCQTFNIILKALGWKLIFSAVMKRPACLRLLSDQAGALIKSVWHSSAPLCIVQPRSEAGMLEDSGLNLVWHYPCAPCRQVNCQTNKLLT